MLRLFFLILMIPFFSTHAKEQAKSAQTVLEEMTTIYSQVAYMKSDFTKLSRSTLLGTEEKSKGKLEYSQKKFRLDISTKPKSTFIKGDKSFWHISGKDVTTGSVQQAVPSIFDAIFSDPSIWSKLKTSYVSSSKNVTEIKVVSEGKIPNISEMTLSLDVKKKTLLKVSYLDDVQNSVEIKLKNTLFFNTPKAKRFVYSPKKGDKISRL